MQRNILLTPGPVTTSERVKRAMLRPDICPRDEEMQKTIKFVRDSLLTIVGGDKNYSAIPLCGSGTLAMEASLCSCYPRIIARHPRKILVVSNGAYGERFFLIGIRHSLPVVSTLGEWGKRIDMTKVKDLLSTGDFTHVFVTHHETSTGILNSINEIGTIAKSYNCTYVIDAISSIGGAPLSIKESKADYIIGSANKCLQGVPGLTFVVAKKSLLEKSTSPNSLYLDLPYNYEFLENTGQMPFTAPSQVLWAFEEALKEFFEEGEENRRKRYRLLNAMILDGMVSRGFKPFLSEDVTHSCLLETFYEPPGFKFKEFHDELQKRGVVIYPGKFNGGGTFRLGNVGDLHEEDITYFFEQLDEVLNESIRK